ncbi:MAG: response regulator [bacterium]|nr:response regulator [bacterium]
MKILVIDDEAMICQLARKVLERSGHDVVVADSGANGYQTYQDNHNSIDLAIIDFHLNDITGLNLIEKMRELNPAQACLLSSGNAPQISEIPKRLRDNTFLLAKPYRSSQLSDKVAEILDSIA